MKLTRRCCLELANIYRTGLADGYSSHSCGFFRSCVLYEENVLKVFYFFYFYEIQIKWISFDLLTWSNFSSDTISTNKTLKQSNKHH